MERMATITVAELSELLEDLTVQIGHYQVWLSSDEEGNTFRPMLKNAEISLEIDDLEKHIVLFPSG